MSAQRDKKTGITFWEVVWAVAVGVVLGVSIWLIIGKITTEDLSAYRKPCLRHGGAAQIYTPTPFIGQRVFVCRDGWVAK